MIFIRKRYYFWLIKEYFRKWKKIISLFIFLGVILFFTSFALYKVYLAPLLEKKVEKIGTIGAYTLDNLPLQITQQLSFGLTSVSNLQEVTPAAAASWEVKDQGKEFIFYLKKGLFFHNGQELTTDNLSLSFKDVETKKIDKYTVSYVLKNAYSPFLSTVSKPIFTDGLEGLGEYKLKKIDLNAGFVKHLSIQNKNNPRIRKDIYFYPNEEAIKMAFVLGEIDAMTGLSNLYVKNENITDWKNAKINKNTNYNRLITVFYNNSDSILSDKKIRQALNLSLPDNLLYGERAHSPIKPDSIYYSLPANYLASDIEIAKTMLSGVQTPASDIKLEISTSKELENVAKIVSQAWQALGLEIKIKIVDDIPHDFQILLYSFKMPNDPDQYSLWHSDHPNNIARYKSLRIDKLLEDGRAEANIGERIKIYSDFQKYILDDVPASFLYFPYEYSVKRSTK